MHKFVKSKCVYHFKDNEYKGIITDMAEYRKNFSNRITVKNKFPADLKNKTKNAARENNYNKELNAYADALQEDDQGITVVAADKYWSDQRNRIKTKKDEQEFYRNINGYFKTKYPLKSTNSLLGDDGLDEREKYFDTIFNKIYKERYLPHFLEQIKEEYVHNFDDYAENARVYVDKKDKGKEDIIKRLVYQREPTNIEYKSKYDKEELKQLAGYEQSAYTTYFNATGELPPNIGIYTNTAFHVPDNVEKNENFEHVYRNGHVYHAIGYAFDDKRQPDYKYLYAKNGEWNYDDLVTRYESVLRRAFQCAIDLKLKTIVFSLIGSSAFAGLIGGTNFFLNAVLIPAFKNTYTNMKAAHELDIKVMDTEKPEQFMKAMKKKKGTFKGVDIKWVGAFPALLNKIYIENTLLVNAWDPHSVVGNGNSNDSSIDGWIGRYSNIQLFGWGLTNPYLMDPKRFEYVE